MEQPLPNRQATAPRRLVALLVLVVGALVGAPVARAAEPVFVHRPYLQLGEEPGPDRLSLVWTTPADAAGAGPWTVEVRTTPEGPWTAAPAPAAPRRVAVEEVAPFLVHRATLAGLLPGGRFAYRVSRAGTVLFQAEAKAPAAAGSPQRFAVFGDCAADTPGQRTVAFQTLRAAPDYVVVTGDIVYSRGRVSEYNHHFFPVYNADNPSPEAGGPLLRSLPMIGVPGNHDLADGNLDKYPDGLAYFYFWDPPRNGPLNVPGAPGAPLLKGSAAHQRAFFAGAGAAYPRTANFSVDLGDVHWTILDSNPYVDWSSGPLRDWLASDLASPAAQKAAWRFVAFHHPGFHSSKAHKDDQRMRRIAPLLQAGKVDVVFSGHVHNYERSHPLRFTPATTPVDGKTTLVDGELGLDRQFDGATHTRPDGIVYIVTGAGGARLYDPAQQDDPKSWLPFTARFVSNVHSLTVVDLTTTRLVLRQVAADGREIDRITITR